MRLVKNMLKMNLGSFDTTLFYPIFTKAWKIYEQTGQTDKQDFMKVTPESLVGLTKVLKFSQSFLTLKNVFHHQMNFLDDPLIGTKSKPFFTLFLPITGSTSKVTILEMCA